MRIRNFFIGNIKGNSKRWCHCKKLPEIPAIFFRVPARYRTLFKRERLVGDNSIFINTCNAAKPLTGCAGAYRRVKGEKLGRKLLIFNTIQFKTVTEKVGFSSDNLQGRIASGFIETAFGCLRDAAENLFIMLSNKTID